MTGDQRSVASSTQRARILSICSSLPGTERTYPFRPTTTVFKISGKMYAALGELEEPNQLTLKCDPDYGALLIQQFDHITPGYHMNKHHWITVLLDASVPSDLLEELIVDSYELVVYTITIDQRPSTVLKDVAID